MWCNKHDEHTHRHTYTHIQLHYLNIKKKRNKYCNEMCIVLCVVQNKIEIFILVLTLNILWILCLPTLVGRVYNTHTYIYTQKELQLKLMFFFYMHFFIYILKNMILCFHFIANAQAGSTCPGGIMQFLWIIPSYTFTYIHIHTCT